MSKFNEALILLDLQNDLCHKEGIYAKHGLYSSHIETILPKIAEIVLFCKKQSIPIIATQLTIILDPNGEAAGLGGIKKMRPFLTKEGFRKGNWGHDLLDEITHVDYQVNKWSISAFYQTELERYLWSLGTEKLILSGFPTNGTVETTAREAVSRNFQIATLTDCVTGYSDALHQASLTNLGAFGDIFTSREWMNSYESKEKPL